MPKPDPRWKTNELTPLTLPPALAELFAREEQQPWGPKYGLATAWDLAIDGLVLPEDSSFEELVGATKLLRNNLQLVAPDHPAIRALGRILWSTNPVLHQGRWDVAPITTRYTNEELGELRCFFAGKIVPARPRRSGPRAPLPPSPAAMPPVPSTGSPAPPPKPKPAPGVPDEDFEWSPRLRGRIQLGPGPRPAVPVEEIGEIGEIGETGETGEIEAGTVAGTETATGPQTDPGTVVQAGDESMVVLRPRHGGTAQAKAHGS